MQIIFPFFDVLKLLIVGILEHFSTEVYKESISDMHKKSDSRKSRLSYK